MRLSPAAFWRLTPREFRIKHEAFARAEDRALYLVGQLALTTTEFKDKHMSVDKLFGRPLHRYPVRTDVG